MGNNVTVNNITVTFYDNKPAGEEVKTLLNQAFTTFNGNGIGLRWDRIPFGWIKNSGIVAIKLTGKLNSTDTGVITQTVQDLFPSLTSNDQQSIVTQIQSTVNLTPPTANLSQGIGSSGGQYILSYAVSYSDPYIIGYYYFADKPKAVSDVNAISNKLILLKNSVHGISEDWEPGLSQAAKAQLIFEHDHFHELIAVTKLSSLSTDLQYTINLPYGFSVTISLDPSTLSGSATVSFKGVTLGTFTITNGRGSIKVSKFGFSLEVYVQYSGGKWEVGGTACAPFVGCKGFSIPF